MKYTVTILLLIVITKNYAQFSEQHVITSDVSTARHVTAADINGDSFVDVLSVSSGDDTIAWYENQDGLGNFGPQKYVTPFLDQTRFATTADIDGDNDIDVLSLSGASDLVVWYENLDGLGTFSPAILISNLVDGPHRVITADIDGDDDLDVFSTSVFDGKIAWYENVDGMGSFGPQQLITNIATTPRNIFAADIDGDNDLDIVSDSSSFNNQPSWYENIDGMGSFGPEQVFAENTAGASDIIAIDIDDDNDEDVVIMEFGGNRISWYENIDGLGNFGPQQIITTNVNATYQIFAADLDNDGDPDVLSASSADNKVAWYENEDGLGTFGPQQIISLEAEGPRSVYAIDLDGDNYKDVLSASILDNKIAWYKNLHDLGIDDFHLNNKIILSPNPVEDLIKITNQSNSAIYSITILDIKGVKLLQVHNPSTQINIENISKGLLFVQIDTNQGKLVKKLLKE